MTSSAQHFFYESMLKTPVFAANWKMNLGPAAARAFLIDFTQRYAARADRSVLFFPPSLLLAGVIDTLRVRPDLVVGIQNAHYEDKGAFTGDVSPQVAKEMGARAMLIGHSERRHVFGEPDAWMAMKVVAAFRNGLKPVLCVGELLEERERGDADRVVGTQLHTVFDALDDAQLHELTIAYEPVWAIGTGKTATPDDAAKMHGYIRESLHRRLGDAAVQVPILYGGSVNPANAQSLLAADQVDGLLVGGASLDPESWAQIVGQ